MDNSGTINYLYVSTDRTTLQKKSLKVNDMIPYTLENGEMCCKGGYPAGIPRGHFVVIYPVGHDVANHPYRVCVIV